MVQLLFQHRPDIRTETCSTICPGSDPALNPSVLELAPAPGCGGRCPRTASSFLLDWGAQSPSRGLRAVVHNPVISDLIRRRHQCGEKEKGEGRERKEGRGSAEEERRNTSFGTKYLVPKCSFYLFWQETESLRLSSGGISSRKLSLIATEQCCYKKK